MSADLTPFGYTPTENLVYAALLELGPSSGYAVARQVGVARANAYQALDGLVSKGAAVLVGTEPRRYRATQPRSLFTIILDGETAKLDRLERELQAAPSEGQDGLVRLAGARAIRDLATRAIVRASGPVRCLAPAGELKGLAPALRARRSSGRELHVWLTGDGAPGLAVTPDGAVDGARLAPYFEAPPLLLHAGGDGALAAVITPGDAGQGYWSGEPVFGALVSAVLDALTT